MKTVIHTANAPAAIGTYSQAIKVNNAVYLSGQIGLNPQTMTMSDDFNEQAEQVFKNLTAVIKEAGCTLQDCVKLNVYLTDLNDFSKLNTIMEKYFPAPFPARAAIQVSALPRGAKIEIDGIVHQS